MKKTSKTTTNSGKPKIVFFGSGPVSAKSLKLLMSNFEIEAIITKPTTVKELSAIAKDTCVYSVANKQDLDKLITSDKFTSKVGVLIDFGIIVSQEVIDYFPHGIINSHFSLLPQLRGADPISFSILSGQTKTGVSLMLIDSGMDTGKILAQGSLTISENSTTPTLTNQLIQLSNTLLKEYLPEYLNGKLNPRKQSHPERATFSRKLTKEDGDLDFNKPSAQLEREIRAFIDWPKSRTTLAGKDVIITQAYSVPSIGADQKPGDITVVKESGLIAIATSNGSLWIEKLKPAGKNQMTSKEFLAGYGQNL